MPWAFPEGEMLIPSNKGRIRSDTEDGSPEESRTSIRLRWEPAQPILRERR